LGITAAERLCEAVADATYRLGSLAAQRIALALIKCADLRGADALIFDLE